MIQNIDNKQDTSKHLLDKLSVGAVSGSYFKILDKDGVEMPDHYSGRRRTYEEAKNMVDSLNKNGEFRPYTMVEV